MKYTVVSSNYRWSGKRSIDCDKLKMYTINPRANTKIKQTLVTANKLPKEKNEAIINTYSKITEKKNYFKEKKMKITIEQINSK